MRILGRGLRLSLFLSTLVAAAVVPQAACIQDAKAQTSEKKKVAVGAFEGGKSGEARSAFIEALKKDGNYEVTDAEDVKHSAKDKAIADSAKGLGVNFIITGKLQKSTLKLKVRKGSNGKVIDEVEVKAASADKLSTAIETTGAATVAPALGVKATEAAKPAAEEAKPEEEEKKEEEKPAEESSGDSGGDSGGESNGLTPLEISAGLSAVHRSFDFHDTIADVYPNSGYTQLLSYELPLGPALYIGATVYPASFFTSGIAEWIGLTVGFEKGFATSSVFLENQQGEKTLKTNMQEFYVGPRFRIPVGDHEIGLGGTYGQHKFLLTGDEDLALPLIPDITYSYFKIGLDGTLHFGDFLVGAHVGKRIVFDTGEIEKVWFPSAKATSLEFGVKAGYRLVSSLDLVVGFDWLKYAFDFNPVPARNPPPTGVESYVAGGAVDQYMSGYLGFEFHLPHSADAK